jgi:hypothetical protein
MVHAANDDRHASTIMDYRKLIEQLCAHGITRNEIATRLCRKNAECGRPIADQEVFELVGQVTEGPPSYAARDQLPMQAEDVTEETEKLKKTEESDRNRPNVRDSDRGVLSPADGDKGDKQQEEKPQTPLEIFQADLDAGVFSQLPFEDYLERAVEEYRRYVEEDCPEEWKVLFYFVRLVKAHPSMTGKSGKQAFREVSAAMECWDRDDQDEQNDDWRHWLGVDGYDAETVFMDAWDKVRYLPGRDALTNAMERAYQRPLRPTGELKDNRPEVYSLFISLAGWLQVIVGDQPIKLPVREVGELLSLNPMTVSRLRRLAVKDGFLKQVKPHRFAGKRGTGEATSFRFDKSRFLVLQQAAQ